MRRSKVVHLVALVALSAVVACGDAAGPKEAIPGAVAHLSISDASRDGTEHFYFLPPMVPQATYSGEFDGSLAPVVRICELQGERCGGTVAEFTTGGAGSERVRVGADHYVVNWHTRDSRVDPSRFYRIEVLIDGARLGHADVDILASAREARAVDAANFVALVRGQTLPIKFRIEKGLVVGGTDFERVSRISASYKTLHINPGDPIISTVPAGDGEVLQFWAAKDATGLPQSVLAVSKRGVDDNAPRQFVQLDGRGRPVYFKSSTGGHMYIEYLSDTRALMRIVTPDGNQVVDIVDAGQTAAVASLSRAPLPTGSLLRNTSPWTPERRAALDRQLAATSILSRQVAQSQTVQPSTALAAASGSAENLVKVSIRAGVPGGTTAPITQAYVTGEWRIVDSSTAPAATTAAGGSILFPTGTQDGVWLGRISTVASTSTADELRDMCNLAKEKSGTICTWVAAFKEAFEYACFARLRGGAAVVCTEFVGLTDNICSKGTAVCDLATKGLDAYMASSRSVIVHVTVGGYQLVEFTEGKSASFPPPVPNPMAFDFLVPLRVHLSVSPSDPGPFQDYVAMTSVIPALAQLQVDMSMSGSDGYTQANSGLTDGAGRFSMYVPGAAEGVTDDITTTVAGMTYRTSLLF